MTRKGSWKAEFDRKYNHLLNQGSSSAIDRANEVLLKGLEGLDQIQKQIAAQEHPYNLKPATE